MYEYDVYADAGRAIPRLKEPLQTLEGEYFLIKVDPLAGTMSFSTSKNTMANVTTLPVSRVREILALNRAGEKAETLVGDSDKEVVEEPTYRSEEDSITRFDGKQRRNKRNKRRGDKPERAEREERGDKQERVEKQERGDKPERAEKPKRQEREERAERSDKPREPKPQAEGAEQGAEQGAERSAEHRERRGRRNGGRRNGGRREGGERRTAESKEE